MKMRRTHTIAALALLPALISCSDLPEQEAPLSEAALAAVTEDAGAPKRDLARQVDDLFTNPALGETRALVVMQDGRIAAERYGPGYGHDPQNGRATCRDEVGQSGEIS